MRFLLTAYRHFLLVPFLFILLCGCGVLPHLSNAAVQTIQIKNTVDLKGRTWNIPKGVSLYFHEGSSITNGILVLNDTELSGFPYITCSVKGSISNRDLYVDWFVDKSLASLHENNVYSLLNGHRLIFSNKEYTTRVRRMSPSYPIRVDNMEIEGNGARVTVSDTANVIGTIFCFYGCHNLTINNLVLDGCVALNAKTPPDGRHNLNISHCENVSINNVKSINAMGDGFYINGGEHIVLDKCVAENNGRQGCSIISGKDIIIRNSSFIHTCRNAPMAGIDIEPNDAYTTGLSVVIDSCYFQDNVSVGIGINVGNRAQKDKVGQYKKITISNCTFNGNGYHIMCAARENAGLGQILVTNCTMEKSRFCSIDVNSYSAKNTPHINMNNIRIHNSNLSNGKDYREHRSVIAVHNVSSISVDGPIGNIEFADIEIVQDQIYKDYIDRGILFYPNEKGGYKNVSLGDIRVDLGKPEGNYVRKIQSFAVPPEELIIMDKAKSY